MAASSKPVASVGVAHGQREKAEPEGQQDQVQHLDAPFDTQSLVGTRWRLYRCALTGVKSAKCFSPESFLAPCERCLPATSRISFRDGSGACDIGTVSYTHLRAHETDSYLVCRLLLEKKK